MTIGFREGVSIGEIAVYIPALLIAAWLAAHHGFGRSAGWLFLIIFALARIIGASLQIATISDPTNIGLYTGYAILQNVALSPLMLAALGLLSRLIENINRTHHTIINSRFLKLIELVITVALILGIVGGINASNDFTKTGKFTPGSLSKVGTGLFIACYIAIVLSTILISFSVGHASHGEKRIIFAVMLSLPFLLVRLVYSIMSTFSTDKDFNLLSGSIVMLLAVAAVEELVIVIIYEAVGLTLQQVPRYEVAQGEPIVSPGGRGYESAPMVPKSQRSGRRGGIAGGILRKTIIGRIVTSFIPENNDVEMQRRYPQQRGYR